MLSKLPKPFLIVGDFNFSDIDWKNSTFTSKSAEFFECVQDNFLTQHIDFPTHRSGTTPDLVLSSNEELVTSVEDCGNIGASDHAMIMTCLDLAVDRKRQNKETLNWKKANYDLIESKIINIDWKKEFLTKDANSSWKFFTDTINEAVNEAVPKFTPKTSKKPAWMSREILQEIRKKRRRWKAYSASRSNKDLVEYKMSEKKVKKLIKNAKRNHEKKIAKNAKEDPRGFWGYLNSKKNCRTSIGPLKVDKKLIDQDQGIAETLNDFFSSVFTKENLDSMPKISSIKENIKPIGAVDTSPTKIAEKLKNLKKFSAPGPDNIRSCIYIELADVISIPLSIIFHKSISTGIVPEQWKEANVTPIFKKGSKSEPGNYRPISLTCIACKVMESLIKDTVVDHLTENELIFPSQHGFMKKRSCLTNLLEYLETVLNYVDNGHSVDVVYLDFSKAFDKVPHRRLSHIMKAHGINGIILTWIENWLSGRKQRVILNGKASFWKLVLSGVPQGSVLGPILFIIFINLFDLSVKELIEIISKFADDSKMGKIVDTEEDSDTLQEAINRIVKWAKEWQMEYNVDKCHVLHFGKNNPKRPYTMSGLVPGDWEWVLEASNFEKDVGVHISNDLKPSLQCSKSAKKANQTLGRMGRAFSYRDKHTWLKLYKVLSVLCLNMLFKPGALGWQKI